jgi:hypothetical protein
LVASCWRYSLHFNKYSGLTGFYRLDCFTDADGCSWMVIHNEQVKHKFKVKWILIILLLASCAGQRDIIETRQVQVMFVKEMKTYRWDMNQYKEVSRYVYVDHDGSSYLLPRYEGLATMIYGFVSK